MAQFIRQIQSLFQLGAQMAIIMHAIRHVGNKLIHHT